MSLGPDIKEVLQEVGTSITILRSPVNITGEYIKTKINAQVTKPFIREFFLEVTLANDTQVVAGDTLLLADGRYFIVMNMTPVLFENEVYCFSAVFYKCNAVGIIKRRQELRIKYKQHIAWPNIATDCHALLTESYYGNKLDEDERVGPVSLNSIDCYLPHSKGAQKGDRFWISSTEYYQVEHIFIRRFDNVDLAILGEDTRE